jgi:two-component system, OmpR family, KDP operon response regulator KdpE
MGMPTILVVEDEPNVRKLVVVNLAQRGYGILEAANGQQALEQLHSQKPALMVLDIKLPDIAGWDILNHIIAAPDLSADLPVLIMTASPVDHNIILSQYPSVIEILVKPFNTARLVTAIQHALLKA